MTAPSCPLSFRCSDIKLIIIIAVHTCAPGIRVDQLGFTLIKSSCIDVSCADQSSRFASKFQLQIDYVILPTFLLQIPPGYPEQAEEKEDEGFFSLDPYSGDNYKRP